MVYILYMKIKILISILTCLIAQAQTYGLKKVVELPKGSPSLSMIHDDALVFSPEFLGAGTDCYLLDSEKISLSTFKMKTAVKIAPRTNGGAFIFGSNRSFQYGLVEDLKEYLATEKYYTKILDTIFNDRAVSATTNEAFDVDSQDYLYTVYNYYSGGPYNSENIYKDKEFIIKRLNLTSMKPKKRLFTYSEFGKSNNLYLMKFDKLNNELSFATDKFFIRVDTNLNMVSKIAYTKWQPWLTTMDKHSNLSTISHDTLYYLNKNLEIIKHFKLDLSAGTITQIEVDSKDRVLLKLYKQGIYTLYQVDFNNIVTQTTDEDAQTETYITQTSSHGFELNTDQVTQVSLYNMLGQVERYDQATFSSQLKGLMVMNLHLKNGKVLSQKIYLGEL